MTEQDLINLGFDRNDDSDGGEDYYYYTYELSKEDNNFCLISASSDDPEWWVEFFNFDTIRFTDINELKLFIDIIKRNTFTKPARNQNDNINVEQFLKALQ
jgi:hypothetical protein